MNADTLSRLCYVILELAQAPAFRDPLKESSIAGHLGKWTLFLLAFSNGGNSTPTPDALNFFELPL